MLLNSLANSLKCVAVAGLNGRHHLYPVAMTQASREVIFLK